jgi:hypothetical protein
MDKGVIGLHPKQDAISPVEEAPAFLNLSASGSAIISGGWALKKH